MSSFSTKYKTLDQRDDRDLKLSNSGTREAEVTFKKSGDGFRSHFALGEQHEGGPDAPKHQQQRRLEETTTQHRQEYRPCNVSSDSIRQGREEQRRHQAKMKAHHYSLGSSDPSKDPFQSSQTMHQKTYRPMNESFYHDQVREAEQRERRRNDANASHAWKNSEQSEKAWIDHRQNSVAHRDFKNPGKMNQYQMKDPSETRATHFKLGSEGGNYVTTHESSFPPKSTMKEISLSEKGKLNGSSIKNGMRDEHWVPHLQSTYEQQFPGHTPSGEPPVKSSMTASSITVGTHPNEFKSTYTGEFRPVRFVEGKQDYK
eukprot:gb/GECH01000444.1/.p1 GENE.gb/GECH01000444.1/~~gb/GECH01000444.1/.p1  ORF type:complete len:315 (+),score=92.41 gb/GECH01000444.1/:1-945(+)